MVIALLFSLEIQIEICLDITNPHFGSRLVQLLMVTIWSAVLIIGFVVIFVQQYFTVGLSIVGLCILSSWVCKIISRLHFQNKPCHSKNCQHIPPYRPRIATTTTNNTATTEAGSTAIPQSASPHTHHSQANYPFQAPPPYKDYILGKGNKK